MPDSLSVPFGLHNGRMADAATLRRNPLASAVCAQCGHPLEVRNSLLEQPDFVHRDHASCPDAALVAVELAARQVIADAGRLQVPGSDVVAEARDLGGIVHRVSRAVAPRTLHFSSVALEQPMGTVVPDVFARVDASPLIVEVMTRDEPERFAALSGLGLPLLVLDLAGLAIPGSFAEFADRVLYSLDRKRWVRNLDEPQVAREVADELAAEVAAANQPYLQAKARQDEEERQRALRIERYRQQSPDEKLDAALKRIGLPRDGALPRFLDCEVAGDGAFGVDRKVWQTAVFTAFVSGKFSRFADPYPFSADRVIAWLKDRFEVSPPFPHAEAVAVWKYLKALEAAGFLVYLKNRRFKVVHDNALELPAAPVCGPQCAQDATEPVPEAPVPHPEPEAPAALASAPDAPVAPAPAPEKVLWAWSESLPAQMRIDSALSQVFWEAERPEAYVAIAGAVEERMRTRLPIEAVAEFVRDEGLSENDVLTFLENAGFVQPTGRLFFAE